MRNKIGADQLTNRFTGTTTDNAFHELFLEGVMDSRLTLGDNVVWGFKATFVGRTTPLVDAATYIVVGGIKRVTTNGSTAIVDTTTLTILTKEDDAAWDIQITADTTNGSLKIEVKGNTGDTVTWIVYVELFENSE